MPETTLDQYDESLEREPVAFAYELAKFTVFDDPEYSDRTIIDWHWKISETKPSEEEWSQNDRIEHRIRNITPLVRGPDDAATDTILGFEFAYVSPWDGTVKEALVVEGSPTRNPSDSTDDVVRCHPLVPKEPL